MDASGHVDAPAYTPRLADRLAAARRTCFVGRQVELDLLRSALLANAPPFAVLYVHAPGGVGKTALLAEYARIAAEAGVPVIRLDGRDVDPSPPGFLRALSLALGIAEGDSPLEALCRQPRGVLLIDTFETLAPLESWLRESFLPQLPEPYLVVAAGRNPPATPWRADPSWQGLVRIVSLRNLRPEESRAYLGARGVPTDEHPAALAFTHGHPLALALVADVLTQDSAPVSFSPEQAPDLVRTLLERFLQQVPSPAHRLALEACAHARVTSEESLSAVLQTPDAPDIFSWMRELSFIEQGPEGLFPHDLAREVLDADLRWRNPEGYREMHRRVRGPIIRRLCEARGIEQNRAFADLSYLHRFNPFVRRIHYVDWESLGTGYTEPASADHIPAILAMVSRHEGDESAQIAAHWAERQPHAFTTFRGSDGALIGFAAILQLHQVTPQDLAVDPAARAALDFALRFGPVRPGEEMHHLRFWMGRESYQIVSPAFNLVGVTAVSDWVSTARLAWTFLTIADPDYWHATFTYLRMRRSPEAGFTVGGHHYAVYTHDWRTEPPLVWLELMGEREIDPDLTVEQIEVAPPAPLVVLSEPEFADAVRHVLRHYTRPASLASNPLLRSRLAVETAEGAPAPPTLQVLIQDAAATLRDHPRDDKLYRALLLTYLEPAATQELAAERLGLPFSTYRNHLATAIARVTDWLWQRELHGIET